MISIDIENHFKNEGVPDVPWLQIKVGTCLAQYWRGCPTCPLSPKYCLIEVNVFAIHIGRTYNPY